MADKIKDIINQINVPMIKRLGKENMCEHKWEAYAFGFKCAVCGYYSGLNMRLNKLIRKILNGNNNRK